MFTGIVERRAAVVEVEGGPQGTRLVLEVGSLAGELRPGASVAVDGVCLTVVEVDDDRVTVEVVPETLHRTTLGDLRRGDGVNLERAVRAADRLEGHLVQGHVDGTGEVREVRPEGSGRRMRIGVPGDLAPYLVEKGSVAVDGVSLTVAALGEGWFEAALVPHTLAVTSLGERRPGDRVNLEVDVLAKYVERLLQARSGGTGEGVPA